jgi:hypothetical protein
MYKSVLPSAIRLAAIVLKVVAPQSQLPHHLDKPRLRMCFVFGIPMGLLITHITDLCTDNGLE